MIRQFYIKNSNGEMLNLNEIEHFFMDPSGLGTEHKFTFEQVGNYFLQTGNNISQKKIDGKIFIKTYSEYRDFARFCMYNPMTLVYSTDETYNIEVKLQQLEKTEKEVGGLYCRIRLISNGMWYKAIESQNSGTEEGKKYDYEYNYTYTNSAASTIEADIDSLHDAPTKLTIFGPASNPSWEHRVNGLVDTTGKVNVTIPSGKKLVIDTTEIPYSIILSDSSGENPQNVYQYSDFSTKRFIKMKNGRNVVRISHEGSNELRLSLERREMYETI